MVQTRLMRDRFARVARRARELQRLGSVEGGGGADFADLLGVYLKSEGDMSALWERIGEGRGRVREQESGKKEGAEKRRVRG